MFRRGGLASLFASRSTGLIIFLAVIGSAVFLHQRGEIPTGIVVLMSTLAIVLVLIIGRMVCVVLHELGHALMALCFSPQPVVVYIGTYGATDRSFYLRFRRLTIWLTRNPLKWALGGMCQHTTVSTAGSGVILLSGPLLPVLVLAGMATCSVWLKWPAVTTVTLVILLLPSLVSLVRSLTSSALPNPDIAGQILHSDGKQLRELFGRWRARTPYDAAMAAYERGDYVAAAADLRTVLATGVRTAHVYRTLLSSLIALEEFEQVMTLRTELVEFADLSADDYYLLAFVAIRQRDYEQALTDFRTTLQLNPQHPTAFVNQGYALMSLNRYAEALAIYDEVLAKNPADCYSHANRGWVRLLSGDAAGLTELEEAVQQAPDTNAYGYFHLGVYQFNQGRPAEALSFLRRAQEIDPDVHLLSDWVARAEAASQSNSTMN